MPFSYAGENVKTSRQSCPREVLDVRNQTRHTTKDEIKATAERALRRLLAEAPSEKRPRNESDRDSEENRQPPLTTGYLVADHRVIRGRVPIVGRERKYREEAHESCNNGDYPACRRPHGHNLENTRVINQDYELRRGYANVESFVKVLHRGEQIPVLEIPPLGSLVYAVGIGPVVPRTSAVAPISLPVMHRR